MDDEGYLQVEVDGATGIIPIKYLHPIDLDKMEAELLKNKRKAHLDKLSGRIYNKQLTVPSPMSQNQAPSSPLNQTFPIVEPNMMQNHNRTRSLSPVRPAQGEATSFSNTRHTGSNMSSSAAPGADRRVQCKPHAPSDLRVEVVANQKLYLEWSYIQFIDHMARSNGTQVIGFRVNNN